MRKLMVISMLLLGAARLPGGEAATTAAPAPDLVRALLNQAAGSAVSALGKVDGFMGNPDVRIPLPGKLQKASKTLHKLGVSRQTDELQLAMNRAAEAAVAEASGIVLDAIRNSSLTDAANIIAGPAGAATEYFRQSTSDQLVAKLRPIVDRTTNDVQLAMLYEAVAAKARALGVLDDKDISLEGYVTRKTLDGLFLMMAREEAALRSVAPR